MTENLKILIKVSKINNENSIPPFPSTPDGLEFEEISVDSIDGLNPEIIFFAVVARQSILAAKDILIAIIQSHSVRAIKIGDFEIKNPDKKTLQDLLVKLTKDN